MMVADPAVRAILEDWRSRIRHSAGQRPRGGDRGARENALVAALLTASEALQHDASALQAVALSAAAYGEDKHRDRLDPSTLCDEFAQLRDAAWSQFHAACAPPGAAQERILRFDRALSVAVRAAISGGYRCELERRGAWESALRNIVHDSLDVPRRRGMEERHRVPPAGSR